MKNFEYCVYTYKHRLALKEVIKSNKYLPYDIKVKLLKRAEVHDMDKMVMYLFWDKKKSSKYHRETASHHIDNNIFKINLDYLETIFDYECAGITKPDKPLNAYDTVLKYYPQYKGVLMPILKELHMDSSYRLHDTFGITKLIVTEDDIIREVVKYLTSNDDNIYTRLKDKLCSKEDYNNLISKGYAVKTIRGLDDAYNKLLVRINDFYSDRNKNERASKKLLTGVCDDYLELKQDIDTQHSLRLCCNCDGNTGSLIWYIDLPTVSSVCNARSTVHFYDTSSNPFFPSFNKLRGSLSHYIDCYSVKNIELLKTDRLCVYNRDDFIVGIVDNEIVFLFRLDIYDIDKLTCELVDKQLIFRFKNTVWYYSLYVSVLDYSVIDYVNSKYKYKLR